MMADTRYIARLIDDLRGGDKRKQLQALERLAHLHDPQVVPAILERLSDRDREIRQQAVEVLGNIGSDAATHQLIETAQHDRSSQVRIAAIKALARLEDIQALPTIIGVLLTDTSSYVRREAAQALETFDDIEAVPALIEALLADENSFVRYAAAHALGNIADSSAVEALEHVMIHDENDYVRYACARAVGNIGDITSLPTLIRALNTKNTYIWHAAAEAIWSFGEEGVDIVVGMLTDNDPLLRKLALKATIWLTTEHDDEMARDRDDAQFGGMWGWWN
jgi:HEAT repeat protein